MTNSTQVPAPFDFSSFDIRRRIAVASILGLLIVASGYFIAAQPVDQPAGDLTAVVVPPASESVDRENAPRSALLDGEAFSEAVERSIDNSPAGLSRAATHSARSVLLDGHEFRLAVDRSLALSTSALLDQAAFADAVADAVDAARICEPKS